MNRHQLRLPLLLTLVLSLVILGACDQLALRPAQIRRFHRDADLGQTGSLEVNARVSMCNLSISQADADQLYSLDLTWDAANQKQDVSFTPGTTARLNITLQGKTARAEDVETLLFLSKAIPLNLVLSTGVGESRIDLTDLQVDSMNLEQGVGRLTLHVQDPQQSDCTSLNIQCGVGEMELHDLANLAPREMHFEGGIGSAVLDFSGEGVRDMNAVVEVGIGSIDITLPDSLGVRLRHQNGLPSGMSLPADKFSRRGSDYTTRNYDTAAQKLDLRIKTGLGGVQIHFR